LAFPFFFSSAQYCKYLTSLPILLWFALAYKQILPERREIKEGFYICPFCGTEKIGILGHIKDVHGEEALKSEAVKRLLEQNPEIKIYLKSKSKNKK